MKRHRTAAPFVMKGFLTSNRRLPLDWGTRFPERSPSPGDRSGSSFIRQHVIRFAVAAAANDRRRGIARSDDSSRFGATRPTARSTGIESTGRRAVIWQRQSRTGATRVTRRVETQKGNPGTADASRCGSAQLSSEQSYHSRLPSEQWYRSRYALVAAKKSFVRQTFDVPCAVALRAAMSFAKVWKRVGEELLREAFRGPTTLRWAAWRPAAHSRRRRS